jgi:hypothetical protein
VFLRGIVAAKFVMRCKLTGLPITCLLFSAEIFDNYIVSTVSTWQFGYKLLLLCYSFHPRYIVGRKPKDTVKTYPKKADYGRENFELHNSFWVGSKII